MFLMYCGRRTLKIQDTFPLWGTIKFILILILINQHNASVFQPTETREVPGHAFAAAEEILAAVESISIKRKSVHSASGKKETAWEFKGRRFFC